MYGFLTLKKLKLLEKLMDAVHTTSILNDNSIAAIFKDKSVMMRQGIIGNRCLK